MKQLKFEVDKMELLEEIDNTQFAKARLWAFASGDNKHNLPVSVSALKKAEKSIYDKPILWYYNARTDDAGGHDRFQVPAGFVPRDRANISYEPTEDGRIFFCFDALIWKLYSGKLLDIFNRTDGQKDVSVEIKVGEFSELENDVKGIEDYEYTGITILGEMVNPACDSAKMQITQFAEAKEEYEHNMEHDDAIKEVITSDFSASGGLEEIDVNEEEGEKMANLDKNQESVEDMSEVIENAEDMKSEEMAEASESAESVKNSEDETEEKDEKEEVETEDGVEEEMACGDKEKMEEKPVEEQMAELAEQIKASFSEQINTLETELNALRQFKADVEKQEMQSKINYAISLVSEDLTPEEVQEWREKSVEFETTSMFESALKSFAYDKTKKSSKTDSNEQIRIEVKTNFEDNKPKGIWERLTSK